MFATGRFRDERLEEPLEMYNAFFAQYEPIFEVLVYHLNVITGIDFDQLAFAELMRSPEMRTAVRYLTAPPISEDDLVTLADTSIAPATMRVDAEAALRVRNIIGQVLDPHRFPWVVGRRVPTAEERRAAVVASAALVAARRVETQRRNDARGNQEGLVRDSLIAAGFVEVPRRTIAMIDDAPTPGHFCAESILGDTRADFIVRLRDRRVLPIECKVSNSSVNSVKRLNREAVGKARSWLSAFGKRTVVPSAVLAGVFSPPTIETAQDDGLFIFWAHRLTDLEQFLAAAT